MSINGWTIYSALVFLIFFLIFFITLFNSKSETIKYIIIIDCIISIFLSFILYFGMSWYYNNTASGQKELVDQKSNLNNGLERIVTIYTANGNIIAEYKGIFDIEDNDGGYVLFDYNGKRYTYYNCFVESIAEIE